MNDYGWSVLETLASIAVLHLPVAAAWLIARIGRRRNWRRWIALPAALLGPALAYASPWLPVGFWDAGVVGGEMGIAFAVALTADRPDLVLVAMGTAVALGAFGIEATSREADGARAGMSFEFPPRLFVESTRSMIARGEMPMRWRTFDGELNVEAHAPYILHIGDSLIEGAGVQRDESALALLQEHVPAVEEVNLGMAGTGPDIQYVELMRWLSRTPARPSMVIQHFFVGNDLSDLDCDRNFCGGAGPVEYGPDGAFPCRHLKWRYSTKGMISEAPAPYLVRALLPVSNAARAAAAALDGMARQAEGCYRWGPDTDPLDLHDETRWKHLEAIFRGERDELKRRGIPFAVAVIPLRSMLESSHPDDTVAAQISTRVVATLTLLGIRTFDSTPMFRDAVRTGGPAAVFLPAPDIHLNPRGHQLYAAWLAKQLEAELKR